MLVYVNQSSLRILLQTQLSCCGAAMEKISTEEFAKLVQEGNAQVIDSRKPFYFKNKRIRKAVNIFKPDSDVKVDTNVLLYGDDVEIMAWLSQKAKLKILDGTFEDLAKQYPELIATKEKPQRKQVNEPREVRVYQLSEIKLLTSELTAIQRDFFQHIKNLEEPHWFNQDAFLKVYPPLPRENFLKIIQRLCLWHAAFRTFYEPKGDSWIQVEIPIFEFPVSSIFDWREESNLTHEDVVRACNESNATLNFEKGPIARFIVFNTPRGQFCHIAMHHLMVDGISWRIIVTDMNELAKTKEVVMFREAADWKIWVNNSIESVQSGALDNEIEYWKKLAFFSV